jgi:hypothetical protein
MDQHACIKSIKIYKNVGEMIFCSHVHMLPLCRKWILKCQKLGKICTYIFLYSTWSCKVSWKADILCVVCKKDKNIRRERAYFSTKFYHFYIDHIKSWFLLKNLCRHVEHGYVQKIFLFQIFWYFHIYQKMHSK